jgi:hypothetical protein
MHKRLIIAFVLALTLAGCSANKAGAPAPTRGPAPVDAQKVQQEARAPGTASEGTAANAAVTLAQVEQAGASVTPTDRKIIRNGDITLQVDDPREAAKVATRLAESNGGFVVTSETRLSSSDRVSVAVTIRVPSEKFSETLEAVRNIGRKVISEKITGQDVTEEYIDVQARIRTKLALEAQFLEILKQAKTVAETLEVQRQANQVRDEIERLEGRRRFLENQAALSTIIVHLEPEAAVVTSTKSGFIDHVRHAFGDAIDTGMAIIIGFIRFLGVAIPVFVLIILPGWLIVRWVGRRLLRRYRSSSAGGPPAAPGDAPGSAPE